MDVDGTLAKEGAPVERRKPGHQMEGPRERRAIKRDEATLEAQHEQFTKDLVAAQAKVAAHTNEDVVSNHPAYEESVRQANNIRAQADGCV